MPKDQDTGRSEPVPREPTRWNWENRNITPAIVEDARQLRDAGGSVEDIIRYLREHGANAIDTIIGLRDFYGMSLMEARIALHSSPSWPALHGKG